MPQTITKAQVANERHMKKLFGLIPYGFTGEKDTTAAAPPTQTPFNRRLRRRTRTHAEPMKSQFIGN